MLLQAGGHHGTQQRFVGLAWGGEALSYDDGVTTGTARRRAFLAFTRHPNVAAILSPYDIVGSDVADPTHGIVVDSNDAALFVGAAAMVERFLRSLIPPLTARGRAIAIELADAMARRAIRTPTVEEVHAAMAREAELHAALLRWLAALDDTAR